MLRYIFMVVAVSFFALAAVSWLHDNPRVVESAATALQDRTEAQLARRTVTDPAPSTRIYSGTERLRADANGHYVAEFSLNSRRVTGVVDTGATMIAMNQSQARRIGINVRPDEFVYAVKTANGTTGAALVQVREVRLGTIRVQDVEAIVLDDDALDTVLIGMSFLKRLRNFQFSNGTLEMKL